MKLEELIYKRFVESEKLINQLTIYSGYPAIFFPEAPLDSQEGWEGETQYPRITYGIDMQANEERKSAGTLTVSLFCQNTADIFPDEIALGVKNCLKDVLLKVGDTLHAFAWERQEAFSIPEKEENLVIGCDIRFDILEYATQETTDPDPVMAVNQYIKELFPECIVVGLDRMEEVTEPSEKAPVIYCRLMEIEKGKETNTVAWMNGKLAVHILCPESETRLKITAAIANEMALDGEIIMLDKSPMFINKLQWDNKSDYLKEGQIFLDVNYGLLRYRPKPHVLRQAKVKENSGGA